MTTPAIEDVQRFVASDVAGRLKTFSIRYRHGAGVVEVSAFDADEAKRKAEDLFGGETPIIKLGGAFEMDEPEEIA